MLENINPRAPLSQTLNKIPFILQIVIGLIIGIFLAFIFPNDKAIIPTFGTLFVKALKAVAPILVFVLVSSAIARHKQGQQSNMKPIIALYFISMVLSATLALLMSYVFPSTFNILSEHVENISAPQGISEVIINFFRAAHDNTKRVLEDLAQSISGVVRIVIRFAPLGVMGLVYSSCTAEGGFANLLNYVHVVCVLLGTMLLIAFVLNAIIVYIATRENPFPLILTCITRSAVTAFFTRSSAANLPVNLELCEKLNLPRETYSISIPLGCTINMSGAAVTIVIMTMAAVHTLGIDVDFGSALLMCIAAVLCACGASGVAGGSLMLIPLACSIFGIGNDIAMQVVGIGFIIGVLQDSTETALNSSTDVLFTAAACKRAERIKKEQEAKNSSK